MLVQIAVADEWKITGALDQGVEYDDNISLREVATPAFGYHLRPSFGADWNSALMRVGINGRGDIRRYDDERWDCENFSLGFNQRYLQRRNVFSLASSYSQSCTYAQQLSDTGILVPNNQSDNYNLSPAWNWQWTPRDQLSLSPSYTQTSYSSSGSTNNATSGVNFRSNETYSLDLSEKHEWSRRLAGTTGLFFSHTEFSNSGVSSSQNVFGFQLGGQYAITRSWSINAGGGGRWVQMPSTLGSSNNSGDSLLFTKIGNLALNYKGRDVDYSVTYSRTTNPSAFGQVQEYSSVDLKWSYQVTRDLAFNIDGRYSENQAVGQSNFQSAQSRIFYTASTELVWKFTKDWQLSASYKHRRQEFLDEGGTQASNSLAGVRDSNSIMIHLNYNWDGLRVSR